MTDIRDQDFPPREDVHHGEKSPRPRRSFTPEFKSEIVELRRRGDRSVRRIAKDFDLTETTVRLWVSQAEVDAGERDGLTSDAAARAGRVPLPPASAFGACRSDCPRLPHPCQARRLGVPTR
ncbi:transposase [Streptomyces sp. NPDC004647]|uniref:transposase n=1 Tax=Streptomyces sp. NPDC004647 TaxID=3154671 RepID=UPI0033B9B2E1